MQVSIVQFPATRVGAIEHRGPHELEVETARKLIAWRIEQRLGAEQYPSYGVHYIDPRTTLPASHRVDFCVSIKHEVAHNPYGIVAKTIPGGRCALALHLGSRAHNAAAVYRYQT